VASRGLFDRHKRIDVGAAEVGHFVIPVLNNGICSGVKSILVSLGRVECLVEVLPDPGSIQHRPHGVMVKGALVCPSLCNCLKLIVPHQLPHVRRSRLAWLLTLGDPPPKLVVFLQNSCLPRFCHFSQDCFSSAGIRGALVKAHRVLGVNGTVVRSAGSTHTFVPVCTCSCCCRLSCGSGQFR